MDRKTDLSQYRTSLLSGPQWASLSADAIALVEQATESHPYKLKQQHLTSLVKLAAWRGPLIDSWALDDVLTEAAVEAFLGHLVAAGTSPNTLQNHRTRLGRLLRVRAGQPTLAKTTKTPSGPPPYTDAELASLLRFAPAELREGVARAIVLGAGAGLGPPEWFQVEIVSDDAGSWIEEPDGTRRPLFATAVGALPAGRLSKRLWSAVLAWSRDTDDAVALDRHRLAATFTVRAITCPQLTSAAWLTAFRLSRGAIERALPHTRDFDETLVTRWLRGN